MDAILNSDTFDDKASSKMTPYITSVKGSRYFFRRLKLFLPLPTLTEKKIMQNLVCPYGRIRLVLI
jgi:hypothetical protein